MTQTINEERISYISKTLGANATQKNIEFNSVKEKGSLEERELCKSSY